MKGIAWGQEYSMECWILYCAKYNKDDRKFAIPYGEDNQEFSQALDTCHQKVQKSFPVSLLFSTCNDIYQCFLFCSWLFSYFHARAAILLLGYQVCNKSCCSIFLCHASYHSHTIITKGAHILLQQSPLLPLPLILDHLRTTNRFLFSLWLAIWHVNRHNCTSCCLVTYGLMTFRINTTSQWTQVCYRPLSQTLLKDTKVT